MFFTNIFTFLLIFVLFFFTFFFRWMKWVEDGSQQKFDLFGFRMKVVCEVHILSRFHFFFQLSQPNSSSFTQISIFSAFSSKQFIFLPRSWFCSTFSMFFTNIFTSLLIFVFIFFFRWMKWVEDGSRPRFDLFGFKIKVVCEVHILSRFQFFFSFLNQTVHLFTQILVFFSFLRQTVHLLIILLPRSWFF